MTTASIPGSSALSKRRALRTTRRLVTGGLLGGALLLGGNARADIDQVSVPGANGSTQISGQWLQTFTAAESGPLQGLWIAADATSCSDGVLIAVVPIAWHGGSNPGTMGSLELFGAPASTWQGGNAGNLQYAPLPDEMRLVAGSTYGIWLGCEGTASPPVDIVVAKNQYPGELVSMTLPGVLDTGAPVPLPAAATAGENLVFLTQMEPSYAALINDSDPAIQYFGSGWGDYPGRPITFGDVHDDVHATPNDDDGVYYSFTGTGITMLAEVSDGYGPIDVFVDDQFQRVVNANAPGVHNFGGQQLFSLSGLAAGQHTIYAAKSGGAYMVIDGFIVEH